MNINPEKRLHPRQPARIPAKYRETFSIPPEYRNILANDLSLGGVRFLTDTFIPLDTSLIVELQLSGRSKPVRAISRVAWARSRAFGYRYEVGGQFLEIIPSEKQALQSYLEGRA